MTDNKFRDVKAVFFDLDGTLMDTDDQAAERLAKALERFGFRSSLHISRRLVMKAETPVNGLIALIDRLGLDNLLLPLWKSRKRKAAFRIIPGGCRNADDTSGKLPAGSCHHTWCRRSGDVYQ